MSVVVCPLVSRVKVTNILYVALYEIHVNSKYVII